MQSADTSCSRCARIVVTFDKSYRWDCNMANTSFRNLCVTNQLGAPLSWHSAWTCIPITVGGGGEVSLKWWVRSISGLSYIQTILEFFSTCASSELRREQKLVTRTCHHRSMEERVRSWMPPQRPCDLSWDARLCAVAVMKAQSYLVEQRLTAKSLPSSASISFYQS